MKWKKVKTFIIDVLKIALVLELGEIIIKLVCKLLFDIDIDFVVIS